MQKVYVVTSQYGFEALLAGKPVIALVSSRGTQAGD
jgi:capsule polysaccharide export protein KpsC/LpsZ